jgi:hypothetical protein
LELAHQDISLPTNNAEPEESRMQKKTTETSGSYQDPYPPPTQTTHTINQDNYLMRSKKPSASSQTGLPEPEQCNFMLEYHQKQHNTTWASSEDTDTTLTQPS